MGIKKETTKEKFERIWKGIDYHMDELARFFLECEEDPFLKTDYGKKMEEYSKSISAAYLMGKMTMARNKMSDLLTRIMCVDDDDEKPKETEKPEEGKEPKETEKPEEGETTFSMEDMLKSVFGTEDKKEDKEP